MAGTSDDVSRRRFLVDRVRFFDENKPTALWVSSSSSRVDRFELLRVSIAVLLDLRIIGPLRSSNARQTGCGRWNDDELVPISELVASVRRDDDGFLFQEYQLGAGASAAANHFLPDHKVLELPVPAEPNTRR